MADQMTEHEIAMRSWSILNPGATPKEYQEARKKVSRLLSGISAEQHEDLKAKATDGQ